MIPLNLRELGCDFYAGSLHKWLCAGGNSGFLFASRSVHDRIRPTLFVGPLEYAIGPPSTATSPLLAGASRLELRGAVDYPAEAAIGASVRFFERLGTQAVHRRILDLRRCFLRHLRDITEIEILSAMNEATGSGLVAFVARAVAPAKLTARLRQRNIYIHHVVLPQIRWSANRVSFHIMNRRTDVDALVAALAEIVTN